MIEEMLAAHVTMTALYGMLNDLVAKGERTYCASGKVEDKLRWDKLMQARASQVEAMCHFAEAGGAEIVQPAKTPPAEPLNANGRAL